MQEFDLCGLHLCSTLTMKMTKDYAYSPCELQKKKVHKNSM